MIRINQLKLQIPHTEEALEKKIQKTLHLKKGDSFTYRIHRQSLDARRKPELFYVYTVDVTVSNENAVLKHCKGNIQKVEEKHYQIPSHGTEILNARPIVIGSGPAGLFCAYLLALEGYRPLVVERGACVEERKKDVDRFWETGVLDPSSNVQFGEGGAGTFSDGKLNTLVKDKTGRNRFVLETFVKFGADKDILYANKPHIGTDILIDVVSQMRQEIISLGGEFYFHTQVTDVDLTSKTLKLVHLSENSAEEEVSAGAAVFAIGHSARDTFEMLYKHQIPMRAKSFAVGVRIEHPQTLIDHSQYGRDRGNDLPAAAYKLTENLDNGRGVYTFCMCPGGYVVNASSEAGRLAVNGMSYSGRDGQNANSAVIVTVTPEDYGTDDVLAGMAFQRKLEEAAYRAGEGKIPVQLFGDFCEDKASEAEGRVTPQMKGAYHWTNLRPVFPEVIADSLEEGIRSFDQKIKGYADADTVLSGVESRTSSPVRILRDETLQSSVRGLYPCGEGAGYAGGITSAAMDGLKTAEAISRVYRPFDISGTC